MKQSVFLRSVLNKETDPRTVTNGFNLFIIYSFIYLNKVQTTIVYNAPIINYYLYTYVYAAQV